MTELRITNAYIHDCRIANSAGRRDTPPPLPFFARSEATWQSSAHGTIFRSTSLRSPARRRLLPASPPRSAQAPACVAANSKAPALHRLAKPESRATDRRRLRTSLGVTERAKQELCFYIRRRLEHAPSGVFQVSPVICITLAPYLKFYFDVFKLTYKLLFF
jgi:hypothetical protein